MSKSTLIILLVAIALLAGVIALMPMPTQLPLPAPHTADAAALTTVTASAPNAQPSATRPPEISATPGAVGTRPPRPTRDLAASEPEPMGPTAAPTQAPQLIIPDLDLDQAVVAVPIENGSWNLDALGEQVGWLTTTGQQPGGDLAVALVGHVNIALGHPGPFGKLKELEQYDQITYRWGGVEYLYSVQSFETVEPDAVEQLYVPNGKRLLLVTCSDWSYFWSQYARRLIVTASLISSEPSS